MLIQTNSLSFLWTSSKEGSVSSRGIKNRCDFFCVPGVFGKDTRDACDWRVSFRFTTVCDLVCAPSIPEKKSPRCRQPLQTVQRGHRRIPRLTYPSASE